MLKGYYHLIKYYIKKWFRQFISKKIREKFRRWLNIKVIAETLALQSNEINKQTILIAEIIRVLKERTEYHIDVHNESVNDSQIILIGKYSNRDFVKCYSIKDEMFLNLVRHCRELEKYATMGKIDALPNISACIKNKLKEDEIKHI